MYKKITGVDETTSRQNIEQAKETYLNYLSTLSAVKGMDQTRKQDNDLERAEMRRQEKQAESFKFGKMSKTKPFFPTLNTRGFLQSEPMTSYDKEQPYMIGRDKQALIFPKKVKDWSKTF